jgi:hypothetical protein
MKQAEKSSGSMRFIRMLSQRPPGTPWWKGRKRRKNSRCTSPQAAMSSKSSQDAIVPQTTSNNTSPSGCATRHCSRESSMTEK